MIIFTHVTVLNLPRVTEKHNLDGIEVKGQKKKALQTCESFGY
jgi:hypothetical protein